MNIKKLPGPPAEPDLEGAAQEPLFYVQDTRHVVGNCMSWWRPAGEGYTCELDKAGKFTAADVAEMREGIDRPWPVSLVEKHAIRHVRGDNAAMCEDALTRAISTRSSRSSHG